MTEHGLIGKASGRAESTMNQLLTGAIRPTPEILQDIAPALQMPVADLPVIARLPMAYDPNRRGPWRTAHSA